MSRNLRLTIEVPGIFADDLDATAAMYSKDGKNPQPEDYLAVIFEEWMRPEVELTIVTIPGPKSQNHEFEIHAYTASIVGAALSDGDA